MGLGFKNVKRGLEFSHTVPEFETNELDRGPECLNGDLDPRTAGRDLVQGPLKLDVDLESPELDWDLEFYMNEPDTGKCLNWPGIRYHKTGLGFEIA